MLKRVLAGTAVAAVSLMSAATAAQAQAITPAPPATPAPHATVINLHHAYLAHLGHTKAAKIAGNHVRPGQGSPRRRRSPRACSEPNCPLVYNGGSVQHSPHVYLLLWGPNWSSDPSQAASASYLESFYAGLGVQPKDSWSEITSLYGDGSGFPTFTGSVYEGAFQDTSTPPSRRRPEPARRRGRRVRQHPWHHRPGRRPDRGRYAVGDLPARVLLPELRRGQRRLLRLAFQLQRAVHQPALHPRRGQWLRRGHRAEPVRRVLDRRRPRIRGNHHRSFPGLRLVGFGRRIGR